jgi:hypothetical protein
MALANGFLTKQILRLLYGLRLNISVEGPMVEEKKTPVSFQDGIVFFRFSYTTALKCLKVSK